MTYNLRCKLSEDLIYANRCLKLFALDGDDIIKEKVDLMIQKIVVPNSNRDTTLLKEDYNKLECLKLLLLMKLESSQLLETMKTSLIGTETSQQIFGLCLWEFSASCPSVNSDVLEVNLRLLNNEDLIEIVTSFMTVCKECLKNFLTSGTCFYKNCSISPFNIVNLVETVIHVITEKHSRCPFSTVQLFRIKELMNCDKVFIDMALDSNKALSSYTLMKIYPKYSALPFEASVLGNLWARIKLTWKGITWDELNYSEVFHILCMLASQFFPSKPHKDQVKMILLVGDNIFWEVILYGVGQNDPLMRKQSRFLLRKALDFVHLNSEYIGKKLRLELFCWCSDSSGDFMKIWSEYFLVLEALEEKQTHLIEPLLKNYENSTSANINTSISAAWNLPVYLTMFNHDSKAIMKWGLHLFLTQNLVLYSSSTVNIECFILRPFLKTLNNNSLFVKQEDGFHIERDLQKLFSSLMCLPKELRCSFYSKILPRMCDINWGPVPLFYLIRSLSLCDMDDKPWGNSMLATIKLFLTNTIHTHSPLIRVAVQSCLLKIMVGFFETKQLSLFHLADVIGTFSHFETLRRGSESWNLLVNWFKTFLTEEEASKFVSYMLSVLIETSSATVTEVAVNTISFTRMCLLLFDASFLLVRGELDQTKPFCDVTEKTFYLIMFPLFKYFVNISTRPYVPNSVIDCNVQVLSGFVEECNTLSSEPDITRRAVLSVTVNLLEDVVCCYRRRLFSLGHVDDYHTVQSYLKGLYVFSKEKMLLPSLLKASEGMVEDAFQILESQKDLSMPKYCSVKIISWLASLLVDNGSFIWKYYVHCKDKLLVYIKNYLTSGNMSKSFDVHATCESKCTRNIHTLKAFIMSEYMQMHWHILYSLLTVEGVSKGVVFNARNLDLFMSDAVEAVETGGREILSPVMSVIQILLPEIMKESLNSAMEFCSICWKATFELKKSDYFWVAIEKFIKMIFQEEVLLMGKCEKYIMKYAQDLYSQGQTMGRIYQLFISHLSNELNAPIIWQTYYTILVDALVFGPLLRKDQRIYKDTCEYILSFRPKYCVKLSMSCEFSCNSKIRIKGVAILMAIVKTELEAKESEISTTRIAGQIADHLWQNILFTTNEKSRYYGNSHVHRLKQRAMQSLLILEMSLNEGDCQQLMDSLCDSLLVESHQPSVKYLQEWLLVRILAHHPNLRKRMWKVFQQAGVKRPSCMSSFISVVFHLAIALPQTEQEEFIGKCIEYIHPWCMAQQFVVRLYAQVVLQKFWEVVIKEKFGELLSKNQVIFDCINSSLEQGGNTKRNLQKLKESFYFDVFHPVDHFSIETIFYDIPRLGNVSSDEWIQPIEFEAVELHSLITLRNESDVLRHSAAGDWTTKTTACSVVSSSTDGDENINFQKKMMPWKWNDLEDSDCLLQEMNGEKQQVRRGKGNGSLVVVASLVDRMPNLGGLCRTCEAFGVSEYILGSLKYVEDPQFQNLSVSAERWVSIGEVKPFMLGAYLTSMKEKGYSLIGVEQTSDSVKLDHFKFPEKSVLLLGNEKEGIPADLLPLMDVCVEVPQEGLVRSLNVHVTGAIFIWEYSRQQQPNSGSS